MHLVNQMTKKEVTEDTDSVRAILHSTHAWMSTPEIRKLLIPFVRERANVQNCLSKLMLKDQAERKIASAHTADGKYVYRFRSGVVVH